MKTIRGPGIFLAQFAGPEPPFNTLPGIARWAADKGFVGVQMPTTDHRLFDLRKAATSDAYCDEIKGVLVTRQGKRVYGEPVVEKIDPRGKKYYWIGGYELGSVDIENSDITAVRDGYVSVTPISLDLTNYGYLEKLRADLSGRHR